MFAHLLSFCWGIQNKEEMKKKKKKKQKTNKKPPKNKKETSVNCLWEIQGLMSKKIILKNFLDLLLPNTWKTHALLICQWTRRQDSQATCLRICSKSCVWQVTQIQWHRFQWFSNQNWRQMIVVPSSTKSQPVFVSNHLEKQIRYKIFP